MSKICLFLITMFISGQVLAYECPAPNNASGGWVPEFCPDHSKMRDEGIVKSIEQKEVDDASGTGAAVGAVAGGVLGNTVSGKKNKTLGTLIGAVAGGVAGHYGEKYLKKKRVWEVNVKMTDGSEKRFEYESDPELAVGDEVLISGNSIHKKMR